MGLEAKDLRIGNLVLAKCQDAKDHFEQTKVTGIFDDEIHHESIGMTRPLWENNPINISPIPLTEEWLLKFRFTKRGCEWQLEKDELQIK